jgi:hypothetical protein
VRRRISLFSRSCRSVDQDLAPDLAGERRRGQQIDAGVVEVFGGGRELGLDRGDNPVELGPDGVAVGLVEDRADQGGDPRLGGLGHLRQEVTPPSRRAV